MTELQFKTRDFVHLHLHTDYSLLQSTIQLSPLAEKLLELDMKACAITDYANLYGALGFYRKMKAKGLHPIIGIEAFITSGDMADRSSAVASGEKPYYSLVLLAKDLEGYHNLVKLSSKAFTEGFHYKPRIDKALLSQHSKGLIALSGGHSGEIEHHLRQNDVERAEAVALEYASIFEQGDLYLELIDHGQPGDDERNTAVAKLAKKLEIPLVAANNPHYLLSEDALAQEILVCISEGRTLSEHTRNSLQNNRYLRSAEEMWDLFGEKYPEALENTLNIAKQCDLKLAVGDGNLTLPNFPIDPDSGCATMDDYFVKVVRDGLEDIKEKVLMPSLESGFLKYPLEKYDDRLKLELDVILRMGYSGYFLIVWEFIKYAKEKNIPVGPGRGSAAGSLVAYALGITDVDPLQYELFFERFLNPERVSMPDIDIDFCIRGRGEVIQHVCELYGRESVCQIITFGTMASRAAIKDVGRAMNIPYGDVEKIAKLIPPPYRGRNISISQALKDVPDLVAARKADPRIDELIELALKVEGCSRHTSVHAAGVVISPQPLEELVPVAISAKSEFTSQYPMDDLEKLGMLKMDFLGLTTLTIIDDCLTSMKEKLGVEINFGEIPLNDEKTMELFGEGKTDAIFQFESSGMQEICRRLKPKELEDLAALNALYRPGPLDGGMVEDFIKRHRGEKKVEYIVPEMEDILQNTYGVLVYQEQIMQIAQKLAGYSLGEADMMRRAMGKKKPEEMIPHEKKFIGGAVERGISKAKATEIFNLMALFADYGFNRSHSIAYALVAFQTAYLKAHYPEYFYSSVLSHEADNSAKVYKYSNELRELGLLLLPPDVNESDSGFTPSANAVRFGLSAIKGMGNAAANAIIEARKQGKFTSLFDFAGRLDQGAINRRSLESLITAGAFDSIKPEETSVNHWRARLFASIDAALSYGQSVWTDKQRGQSGLFGMAEDAGDEGDDLLKDAEPWSQSEVSAKEKASVGFYLSVHPLDDYKDILAGLFIKNLADIEDLQPDKRIKVAGVVSGTAVKYSKKGNRFCIFRLDDQSAGMKCLVWSEAFQRFSTIIKDDALLIVEGKVETVDGGEITVIVSEVRTLQDAVSKDARHVTVTLPANGLSEDLLHNIYATLNDQQGRCDVTLKLPLNGFEATLRPMAMRVKGSQKLEQELSSLGCVVDWKV